MKARGRLVVLVCSLMALVVLPTGAAAKPGYEVHPGSTKLTISLAEKAGYLFSVSASDKQRVQLAVDEELFSGTEYSTQGRVSSRRIEADFGALGRVSVRVRLATGSSERPRKGNGRCRGRAPLYLWGAYRGAIEFSGEGDVPAVSSKRGRVLFVRRFRQVCKRLSPVKGGKRKQGGEKRQPAFEVGGLLARAKGEGRTTLFEAFNLTPRRNPTLSLGVVLATAHERQEGVRISRTAVEIFSEGIVMSKPGNDPETVKVKLEKPFSGRGFYSHSSGSPARWTGNLGMKLPGADRLPLTGPSFSTDFCRGLSFAKVERCLYGSGSHSQPLALARLSSLR